MNLPIMSSREEGFFDYNSSKNIGFLFQTSSCIIHSKFNIETTIEFIPFHIHFTLIISQDGQNIIWFTLD